ncbi:unnamed protein product [Musa acuminata var. zebrina]
MDLISGFLTPSLGTVTVSTPFSMAAFTCSTLAFSGRRNLRRNLPQLRSTRCQVSVFSSCSRLRSPLIWRTRPSSTSTLTSSFLSPGRSALNTCASGVSFQSTRAAAKADASPGTVAGEKEREVWKGKPWMGSQASREKGSKMRPRREPNPKGVSDILWSDRRLFSGKKTTTTTKRWETESRGDISGICNLGCGKPTS